MNVFFKWWQSVNIDIKYTALFSVVLISYVTYLLLQPSVDYYSAIPYDGKQYLKGAAYFAGGVEEYLVGYPFHSRIGVPYVTSLFSTIDVVTMFIVINSISLVFFFWLLIVFLKTYGNSSFQNISFVVLWMSFHFMGPVRYYFHDPVSIDLPAMVLEALVVLSFFKRWHIILVIAAVLSLFVKESIIPLLVMLSIASVFFHRGQSLVMLLSTLVLVVITKWQIGEFYSMEFFYWKYKSIYTLYYNIKRVILDPVEILQWLASLLFIGSLFLVKIKPLKGLDQNQKTILLLGLYGVGIALVGGNDYTRLQFFSGIFIFSSLVIFMRNIPQKQFFLLLVCSLPFLRLFTIFPKKYSYKTFPEYFDAFTCVLWIGYFLLIFGLYHYFDRRRNKIV